MLPRMIMKRPLTMMLLAAPLALGLFHCTDADGSDDQELAAQVLQPTGDGGSRSLGPEGNDGGGPTIVTPPAADAGTAAPFAITSTVVKDKGMIPSKYRGNVASPPLAWTAGPAGTKSYAIVFRDQGNGFYHWVIYDVPATELGLPEGVPVGAAPTAPAGAKQAPNWAGRVGYGGPAAPGTAISNYLFTLHALDVAQLPGLSARATSAQVEAAIKGHVLASTTLAIQSVRTAP
jgi:Raf kinase inhibitor-like YbhB/YbcL family protein